VPVEKFTKQFTQLKKVVDSLIYRKLGKNSLVQFILHNFSCKFLPGRFQLRIYTGRSEFPTGGKCFFVMAFEIKIITSSVLGENLF